MDLTIKAFVQQEHSSFENFTPPLAARFEEGIMRAITETMRLQLKNKGKAEVALPWGTYHAEAVAKGEAGNIVPTREPSKGFLKLLTSDNLNDADRSECIAQDDFDPQYMKLFKDFVAYGFFYPEAPENKDKLDKNKGVRLSDEEAEYFLCEYAIVLANIARDKQRDGKIFRLEINNGFPHGSFDFEYDDDDIKVSWTADKVFKQILKNDDAAAAAKVSNFTPITEEEGTRRITQARGEGAAKGFTEINDVG